MKKFSLQTALEVKERIEKVKQKEWAEQLQCAQEMKDRIGGLEQEVLQSQQQENELKNNGFTVPQLQFHEGFRRRLDHQKSIVEGQLQEQDEIVSRKQQEFLEATQKRRVLEILKEKELLRNRKKQKRLERIEMDEIAQNLSLKSHN